MLSVRLPKTIEDDLNTYCTGHGTTKSYVVQEALAQYLVKVKPQPEPAAEPDLSFLAPDDPIRRFIGIAKDGMSTDELMRMTRGDDWNQP
jgi:predicted methyltransferase